MIKLSENKGFSILPVGTQVLKITEVSYDEDFGKMEIKLISKSGITHTERYKLLDNDGEVNEKANAAFSYFARTALQSDNNDSYTIDEQELVGKYIRCRVEHEKYAGKGKYEGRMFTNARLKDYEQADSFTDGNKPEIDI